MRSIVLNKVVHVTDTEELCSCDKESSKTCAIRIKNNLPCTEMIVRLTPVDRREDKDGFDAGIDDFRLANKEFIKTLEHLNKMR